VVGDRPAVAAQDQREVEVAGAAHGGM
jgi:hypothetical protein